MMQISDLNDLPLAERLQAMEVLWDSLCHDADFDPSPAWHEDILVQRRSELEGGVHRPWDDVKARLRNLAQSRD